MSMLQKMEEAAVNRSHHHQTFEPRDIGQGGKHFQVEFIRNTPLHRRQLSWRFNHSVG